MPAVTTIDEICYSHTLTRAVYHALVLPLLQMNVSAVYSTFVFLKFAAILKNSVHEGHLWVTI